jgi:TRAP-type C4-dicarboxylate transport system permease small subunit
MKTLSRLLDWLLELCGILSAILIMLITFGITYNVIGRKIFQFKRDMEGFGYFVLDMISYLFVPLPWMTEIVEYFILSITCLTGAWVLKHAAHVNVDLLVSTLSPTRRRVADLTADVLGTIICGIVFYYAIIALKQSFQSGATEYAELPIKEWWYFWLVPFATGLMCLEFGRRVVRTHRVRPELEET